VATLYTAEIAALGVRTSKVVAAYARRHGYQAVIAKDRLDASRPASWSKLLLIERYLTENPACSWLMWLDADAVITNPERRLEDLVDENVDFLAGDDPYYALNAGVFLVRNCAAALDMLRRAYAKVQYIHHPVWEQPALAEAMCECAPALRSRVVSRRLFNSFAGEYQQGDFVVHFAGMSLGEKLAGVVGAIAAMAECSRSGSAKKARDTHNPIVPTVRSLHDLGLRHGTDKASVHSYLPLYEEVLGYLREEPVRLLEIGIWKGSSLLMWADWLPRAEIHGIDLQLPDLAHDRIRMHQHSQCDESALSLLKDDYFDVIIDDGSHHPADQLQSIHYLWSKLRTGGLYFVEDIQDPRYVKYFSTFPGFRHWDLRDQTGRWDDILVMLRKG
jgi:hypothetical protein